MRFYPDEYQYPNSNIGNGKTFVYRDVNDTANLIFMDRKIINEDGKAYLLRRQYNKISTIDYAKYNMDKKIMESYIFLGGDLVNKLKGSILQNEVVDDGSRLGKWISKILLLSECIEPSKILPATGKQKYVLTGFEPISLIHWTIQFYSI